MRRSLDLLDLQMDVFDVSFHKLLLAPVITDVRVFFHYFPEAFPFDAAGIVSNLRCVSEPIHVSDWETCFRSGLTPRW